MLAILTSTRLTHPCARSAIVVLLVPTCLAVAMLKFNAWMFFDDISSLSRGPDTPSKYGLAALVGVLLLGSAALVGLGACGGAIVSIRTPRIESKTEIHTD